MRHVDCTNDADCERCWPQRTFEKIAAELKRARKKFPGNAKLMIALTEEVGELAKALLQGRPREEVVAEAVQVACVAIRIIEEGDSDFDNLTAEQKQR